MVVESSQVNTLYVDKNLKYHGLIQAFSRTNRIFDVQKSQGNIVCFRSLKKATDDAIALFADREAKEIIIIPPYEKLVRDFNKAHVALLQIAPTVNSVDELEDENMKLSFVQALRDLLRLKNILSTFADFSWDDLSIKEQTFSDYQSKYFDLYHEVKSDRMKEKVSVLEEIDFELKLIHKDDINVVYILKLLAEIRKTGGAKDRETKIQSVLNRCHGDPEFHSKKDLIEKFIRENLPAVKESDEIPDEWDRYWEEEKVNALNRLCDEEHLDRNQFLSLIDTYTFSGREPIREEIIHCLDNRPSILQARQISERILDRMKQFVDIFIKGFAV